MAGVADWPPQIWLGIATLITATVAAVISYLNYKNFGKNKIAEFRTKWIDDLRQDMAELYSLHYEVGIINRDIEGAEYAGDEKNARKRRRKLYIKMSLLRRRILLRLKPGSDDPNERELERLLRTTGSSDAEKATLNRRKMVKVTREILKTEWNRVKRELKS